MYAGSTRNGTSAKMLWNRPRTRQLLSTSHPNFNTDANTLRNVVAVIHIPHKHSQEHTFIHQCSLPDQGRAVSRQRSQCRGLQPRTAQRHNADRARGLARRRPQRLPGDAHDASHDMHDADSLLQPISGQPTTARRPA